MVSQFQPQANLYNIKRDDVVMFILEKVLHMLRYTQSKIISENIKWNQKIKTKKLEV